MRIVHEIEDKATVSAGGSLYAKHESATMSSGFRTEVTIIVQSKHPIIPNEEIHIEGNARYVLQALRDAVRRIEDCATIYIHEKEIRADWLSSMSDSI